MKTIISNLEHYLDKKRLELNVGKTKIMRFKKGGRKRRKHTKDGRRKESILSLLLRSKRI